MPAGRKNGLFNDELLDELYNYIKVGNYVNTACAAVGIGTATYYKWMRQGKEVEELVDARPESEDLIDRLREGELILGISELQWRAWNFRDNVLKFTAQGEAYAVAMIRTQMPQQWTAAMTFLERRHPGRWKRREQIDIGEAESASVGIDEELMLQDPKAVKLIHEALKQVAVIESTAVEVDDEKRPGD
jgi:transposase